ncbi:hypothetical protein [Flavobacterium luteolum]|uniref:hypothetical protein n=1 Tax=Flavobacterium luteolum TaxID=3003259 RepID=UPI00248F2C0B|nr:hypothetical protein [Flavobacterium luteolum]
MKQITYDQVVKFIQETEFEYNPGQIEVSFPILERIHKRLQNGNNFSAIKTSNGRIVDGHHRYICHKLLESNPEITPGGTNATQVELLWNHVNVSLVDYDDEDSRRLFAERYDKD